MCPDHVGLLLDEDQADEQDDRSGSREAIDPRLVVIRQRRAAHRAVRAAFAERRAYGLQRRHAAKLARNRAARRNPSNGSAGADPSNPPAADGRATR